MSTMLISAVALFLGVLIFGIVVVADLITSDPD
jgi:hypothetical protein